MDQNDNSMVSKERIKHLIEIKDNTSFIKTFFIKNDCFLIKNLSSNILYSLIVTNWFLNNDQIEFLK